MMKKSFQLVVIVLLTMVVSQDLLAQSGVIRGRVYDALSNEPLEFATVALPDAGTGAYTDSAGVFEIKNLAPGLYNLQVSYTGFKQQSVPELQVTNSKPVVLDLGLEADGSSMDTVVITTSIFNKTAESPVSLRTVGLNEIARNPGGNRDISNVIQSLPGVAGTVGFRNDIIIRGGSPNENRFFLDGIEVPNINHFSTQGASGGPVGLINVNFIREVDLYTGAFPASRGNALSSVMDIKQVTGRDDRFGLNATVSSSDIGATLEGPLTKKTTFIASARRSYLQFLFSAIGLPFLPTYNDFQFKTKTRFNAKNELIVIGLGAVDQFNLNLGADSTRSQQYILGNLPVLTQWNYTVGTNYKHFFDNSFLTAVASRSMINNRSFKYENNDDSDEANKILDYNSQEMENKFRLEHNLRTAGFKIVYGGGYEYIRYTNSTFNRISTPVGIDTIDFSSNLDLHKYSAFGNASRKLMDDRLVLGLGLRFDANSYSSDMSNPLDQFSPRFSFSYYITPELSFNGNTGIYYQLPPFTVMGFRDQDGSLVNQNNGLKYVKSSHIVTGLEYTTGFNAKFSVEGFYKRYQDYPLLLRDSISLANLGGDFGTIGNEPVSSASMGRSYGIELFAQQRLYKGFFGILAYTYVRSEFTNGDGEYAPSSWDNRHIVTSTLGKKLGKTWEIGARWRFYGGTPYTPYNVGLSALTSVWDVTGRGIPDYSRINTERIPAAHNLDMRIDKKWFFDKWSLNLYLDIQNVYNFQAAGTPILDVIRDDMGNPLLDTNNPAAYQIEQLQNPTGSRLPSIGIVIDL